jgi:hypothetical protein
MKILNGERKRHAFESEQAVLRNGKSKKRPLFRVFRTTRTIQDGGGERRNRNIRLLLVLTDKSVVTLSTAEGVKVSLK